MRAATTPSASSSASAPTCPSSTRRSGGRAVGHPCPTTCKRSSSRSPRWRSRWRALPRAQLLPPRRLLLPRWLLRPLRHHGRHHLTTLRRAAVPIASVPRARLAAARPRQKSRTTTTTDISAHGAARRPHRRLRPQPDCGLRPQCSGSCSRTGALQTSVRLLLAPALGRWRLQRPCSSSSARGSSSKTCSSCKPTRGSWPQRRRRPTPLLAMAARRRRRRLGTALRSEAAASEESSSCRRRVALRARPPCRRRA